MRYSKNSELKLSETEEQKTVVNYCRIKSIPVVHIPNEGKRSYRCGAELKEMGMARGFPDLFFPLPRGEFCGLFIEMKVGKNKPSEYQLEWLRTLKRNGYACFVCYGSEQAIQCVEQYLGGYL